MIKNICSSEALAFWTLLLSEQSTQGQAASVPPHPTLQRLPSTRADARRHGRPLSKDCSCDLQLLRLSALHSGKKKSVQEGCKPPSVQPHVRWAPRGQLNDQTHGMKKLFLMTLGSDNACSDSRLIGWYRQFFSSDLCRWRPSSWPAPPSSPLWPPAAPGHRSPGPVRHALLHLHGCHDSRITIPLSVRDSGDWWGRPDLTGVGKLREWRKLLLPHWSKHLEWDFDWTAW